MRRSLRSVLAAPVAAIAVAVVAPASPAVAAPPASFVFEGSGWGHGVGMSQYGARGQAIEGRTADEILRHYYTGTTVGSAQDAVDLRVNVLHDAGAVAMRSEALGTDGGAIRVVAGTTTIDGGPADTFTFANAGGAVEVRKNGTPAGSAPTASVLWSGTPTVVRVASSAGALGSAPRYRYGSIDDRTAGAAPRGQRVSHEADRGRSAYRTGHPPADHLTT